MRLQKWSRFTDICPQMIAASQLNILTFDIRQQHLTYSTTHGLYDRRHVISRSTGVTNNTHDMYIAFRWM